VKVVKDGHTSWCVVLWVQWGFASVQKKTQRKVSKILSNERKRGWMRRMIRIRRASETRKSKYSNTLCFHFGFALSSSACPKIRTESFYLPSQLLLKGPKTIHWKVRIERK
jgi:ribosomal protein L32